jgi:hypothetical protein
LSYSTKSLPREVWRHRGFEPRRHSDHLVMGPRTAGAGIDRDRVALVEDGSDLVEIGVGGANERAPRMNGVRRFVVRGSVGDVRRHDQHGDAAFRQRRLASSYRFAPGLLGRQDHLAIDAAALVHVIEVDLLDRLEPDVLPHDLGRDQDNRRAIAVGFVKPVDEVEAAWAAATGAGRQIAGELRLGPGREGAGLLMPHVHPVDLAEIDGVRDPVQRVADDAVAPFHAGCLKCFD